MRRGRRFQRGTMSRSTYTTPAEEIYLRTVMAIDYLLKKARGDNPPSLEPVKAVLFVITQKSLFLDVKRFKLILKRLINAISNRTVQCWAVLEEVFLKHTIFRKSLALLASLLCFSLLCSGCFFGIEDKSYGATGEYISHYVTSRRKQELLGLKKDSFKYEKIGHKIFVNLLIFSKCLPLLSCHVCV